MRTAALIFAALFLATGTAHAQNAFYPKVTIGGIYVRMVADTGATNVSLSAKDARRIGLNPNTLPKNGLAEPANGTILTSIFTLPEITVEGVVLHNITASCCVIGESLLGMSALEQFEVTFRNGWMRRLPQLAFCSFFRFYAGGMIQHPLFHF